MALRPHSSASTSGAGRESPNACADAALSLAASSGHTTASSNRAWYSCGALLIAPAYSRHAIAPCTCSCLQMRTAVVAAVVVVNSQ
jgi:hypothetical protein